MQARDLASGDLLWDVGPEPGPIERHAYSRPVVLGDDVLVVGYARNEDPPFSLLRLDVATGTERDRIVFADGRLHRPVVADGYLLVPTDQRLVAFARPARPPGSADVTRFRCIRALSSARFPKPITV